MDNNKEEFSGKILGIDCRQCLNKESYKKAKVRLLAPKEYYVCRIRLQYEGCTESEVGYKIVNFDLPDSYIGRDIELIENYWSDGEFMITEEEITSLEGLEKISSRTIKKSI